MKPIMNMSNIIFLTPSSDLGKELGKSTKQYLGMMRKCPLIFHIILEQSNFKVLDSSRILIFTYPNLALMPKLSSNNWHIEDQCFDLHPCQHCRKHNHLLDKCSKLNKSARLNIQYGWFNLWWWSSTTKKIYIIHIKEMDFEFWHSLQQQFCVLLTLYLIEGNTIDWKSRFKFQSLMNQIECSLRRPLY